MEKFADKGTGFEEIAKKVKGTAVQAKPKDGCLSRSSLPEDIANGINSLRINETELFNFEISGQKATFLVKVVSREPQFSIKRGRMWPRSPMPCVSRVHRSGSTRVAEAKIDPRFASGVSMDSSGQATLSPPVGPFQPEGDRANNFKRWRDRPGLGALVVPEPTGDQPAHGEASGALPTVHVVGLGPAVPIW